MGKGSNPNMAIPSLGATAFGRTPARGMVAGGLTALQRAAASNIGRATQGVGGPKGGLGTFFRNLFPSRGSIRSTGPIAGMAPPSLTLGDVARTALLTGPVGAATVLGLSGIDPLTAPLGDGTLAGAYGLTEDEFNQVLQYMQQEGLNFSTDSTEFADLAARLTGKNVPRLSQLQPRPGTGGLFSDVVTPKSREQEALENQAEEQAERIKKAQEEAKNIFEERDKRRMQAGILGAGLETIIRGQKGEPLFQAVAEGLKSQALPAFKEQGEMQLAAQIKKNLQDAKIAAEAQGKVGDLVKLRASIAKQAGETVDPEAKASIVQTLAALDQFLFARFGISAGGGMGPQDLLSQVLAEQSKRSSVVKEATR